METYIERDKREKRRRKLATDDGFWFCICFKSERDMHAFCSFLNIPEERFISGIELEKATDPYAPKADKRSFAAKIPAMPSVNPIAFVEHTGNIETDAISEAMMIFDFFAEAKAPARIRIASQSDIYICACFASRDDADRYQSKMRMARFGTRYVDGGAWLKELIKNGENAS